MAEREWRPPWFMEQFFRLAPWGFPRQILLLSLYQQYVATQCQLPLIPQAVEPRIRWIQAPLARRTVESLPFLAENSLVVDVGAGPGFLCIELAKLLPGAAFIGVEPSPHAVEVARRYGAREGLERFEARQGRAEQIPVDSGVVDLAVSRVSLREWEDVRAGCAEIHRRL